MIFLKIILIKLINKHLGKYTKRTYNKVDFYIAKYFEKIYSLVFVSDKVAFGGAGYTKGSLHNFGRRYQHIEFSLFAIVAVICYLL